MKVTAVTLFFINKSTYNGPPELGLNRTTLHYLTSQTLVRVAEETILRRDKALSLSPPVVLNCDPSAPSHEFANFLHILLDFKLVLFV